MRIFLSFATEDFTTPEHDAVLLRLAEIMRARGICGCFHVTGDIVRHWRRAASSPIVSALAAHELGYHTNTHGAYPFVGEVCTGRSWTEAVQELMLSEGRGLQDVREFFGRMPVYYVTEFSFAPQLMYAMKLLGLEVLGFSGLPGQGRPFCRYMQSICYTGPHQGLELPFQAGRLDQMKQEFDRHYQQGDAMLKLFNHPYKFVYNNNISSWVSVNNLYQGYDLRRNWCEATAGKYPAAVREQLLGDFAALLDYVLEHQDVQFVSTAEAAAARLPRPGKISRRDLAGLPTAVAPAWNLSPAELFGLLVRAMLFDHDLLSTRPLLGPVSNTALPLTGPLSLPLAAVREALAQLDREMDYRTQLPAAWEISGRLLSPADIWRGMLGWLRQPAEMVTFLPGEQEPEIARQEYFARRTWTRDIYPAGFTGEELCAANRRQSWTWA